jgi:hypothetical protein
VTQPGPKYRPGQTVRVAVKDGLNRRDRQTGTIVRLAEGDRVTVVEHTGYWADVPTYRCLTARGVYVAFDEGMIAPDGPGPVPPPPPPPPPPPADQQTLFPHDLGGEG